MVSPFGVVLLHFPQCLIIQVKRENLLLVWCLGRSCLEGNSMSLLQRTVGIQMFHFIFLILFPHLYFSFSIISLQGYVCMSTAVGYARDACALYESAARKLS